MTIVKEAAESLETFLVWEHERGCLGLLLVSPRMSASSP
jgi:hypothetical protein